MTSPGARPPPPPNRPSTTTKRSVPPPPNGRPSVVDEDVPVIFVHLN